MSPPFWAGVGSTNIPYHIRFLFAIGRSGVRIGLLTGSTFYESVLFTLLSRYAFKVSLGTHTENKVLIAHAARFGIRMNFTLRPDRPSPTRPEISTDSCK